MNLNTCGYEHGLSSQFTEGDDPFELEKDYRFSEWYDIIKDDVYTPKSYICSYNDLFDGKIDSIIETMPGSICFARLDVLSSKPSAPYHNSFEINADLKKSCRTSPYFTIDMPIIIREYIEIKSFEFRCFIHDKKLRGISSEYTLDNLDEIMNLVNYLTFITEYESYCVDFTYHNNKLMLIEINTPVWLFACSGLFCLELPYDVEVLMGKYMPDIIDYPVIKCNEVGVDGEYL